MSISTLRQRVEYRGGHPNNRLVKDKERSLKKAIYSYQGQTAILQDEREFKCLINPNKETYDYNDMIISIPFEDVCVNAPRVGKTSEGIVPIGMKAGDVFEWKETGTHWLVYLQYLDEVAYFRAMIRQCEQETEINGRKYGTYIRGPVETDIVWNQKAGVEWNDLNGSMVMFVTKDENTQELSRFTKLKVFDPLTETDKTGEVAGVNAYYGDGMIQVFLNEFFENTIEEEGKAEKEQARIDYEETIDYSEPRIVGPDEVAAYSTARYSVINIKNGKGFINDVEYPAAEDGTLKIDILKRKGEFEIVYRNDTKEIKLLVKVI